MEQIIVKTEAQKNALKQAIEGLPFDPVFEVSIQEHKSKRSVAQNRLYWKWLGEISESVTSKDGEYYSPEKWHYLCALKFLGIDTISDGEKTFAIPVKSTTKLSTKEFSEYLMEIEIEFLPRGAHLTFPDDYDYIIGKSKNVYMAG